MASNDKSETEIETRNTDSGDKKSKSGKYNLRRKTLVVRKEVEQRLVSPKAPKAKSRPPPLSKYRRRAANSRERGRMQEINVAFQELQTVLPIHCLPEIDPKTGITKITTLRLAVNYIAALRGVLGEDSSTPSDPGKPGTSGQEVDRGQSVSSIGTPEHCLDSEDSSTKPSNVPGGLEDECQTPRLSEQCSALNTIRVVSDVAAEDQCRYVHIAEEPAIQVDVTKDDSRNIPQVMEPTVVPCEREFSACGDEPCKQSVEHYQTNLHHEKAFQERKTDVALKGQLLVNNSDLNLLQQTEVSDIVNKEEQTLLTSSNTEKDINLNIDSNNNIRDFDPSSLAFTGSTSFKDGEHHIDSNFVPACLSWMDSEVCGMDTDSVLDTRDTDMDIDTELLVYPDIIRAVINDQFD